MLQGKGVDLYENTCVTEWLTEGNKHRLITSKGEITANKVITAGNAYTPKSFNANIDNCYLPILSNVIVTEPLSEQGATQLWTQYSSSDNGHPHT